ncbi:glycosyltransferase family 4 protein [Sphingomonas asaccharolytica]|uniref:glycosyltransferase family 4 protein n=1 Tax=Sphingomonas asaccharolytica TaxID=40681 RepID=UPI000B33DA91|nr:glycosyltransferase family 4 protein [Sphingomonas asaccharolytica]
MSLDKVLFILGCNEGPSARYRVFNHIEALQGLGIAAEWMWDIHPEIREESYMRDFSIVVNFRGGYSDRLEEMHRLLKRLSIPTVYDIDDLVFDPSLTDQIDAYRKMDAQGQGDYLAGMQSIERAMKAADYVTTSTSYLADYASRFTGKPTWIIPFGVNDRQVEIAQAMSGYSAGPRFITYLSGTATHERDFAEAVDALRRILAEYDDVYLKLVGPLDIETHLPGLQHKVIRVPFMDWKNLVMEAASAYVNIAPFEAASPFCQSKSDLKYVEPALSGVPTIASPVRSFQDSITHGVNGMIAETADDWYAAFKVVLDDRQLRSRMGAAAKRDVERERFPGSIGRKLVDVYRNIIESHRPVARRSGVQNVAAPDPAGLGSKKPLRIAWVIPQPFEASGGHRNIFRAIRYLSEFGHSCSLHVLPDNHRFSRGDEIRKFIADEFFDIIATDGVFHGVDNIPECDVLVCTYWTTAYVVKDNAEKAPLHVYFLQDYEPMFFPMGTDYVRACETYRFGFYPITSGPWPLRMLEKEWGVEHGAFFRFPIDRGIYHAPALPRSNPSKRIAYFARPDMPRRCYPLGVSALEIVKRERPDVEILFYGDKSEKFQHVPFEFTNVGMTPQISDLGDLYRSVDVGVCFSTTNPSLVPFEMMACGLPVVDLDVNGNEVSYGGRENCMLAAASPRDIADKIYAILDDPEKAADLAGRGIEYAREFPTEVEMVRLIEGYMVDEFERMTNMRNFPNSKTNF